MKQGSFASSSTWFGAPMLMGSLILYGRSEANISGRLLLILRAFRLPSI